MTFVDGFQEFLDDHGLLNRELSRDLYRFKLIYVVYHYSKAENYSVISGIQRISRFKRPDFLHLNWGGLAKLGCLIRGTVVWWWCGQE